MTPFETIPRRRFLAQGLKIGAAASLAAARFHSPSHAAEKDGKRTGPWQIGCYTRPWANYDYRVALDAIAEAGFKHAGLMTTKSESRLIISTQTTPEEARKVGEECKKRGLGIPSLWGGNIPVNESLEAGVKGLRRLVDNCVAAGVKNLMMGGSGDGKIFKIYCEAITRCCDYAAEKRVGIAIKPHGGLNATGPQCRKTVEDVGHKNFRVWYDPGNIMYYSDGKLDPVDDAATVDGLVVGMCVKDFTMSVEDGKIKKDVALTPGTGRVDFPKVMARLKKGGFTGGALVIECLAPGDRGQLLAEAKKARRFVERLVGQES